MNVSCSFTRNLLPSYIDCFPFLSSSLAGCSLVSNTISECLNFILIKKSVALAVQYCHGVIADLLTNRLDLSLLVITKSLGKSATSSGYVNKQAHVELAERMRKRDPRSAPSVGDRVAYVITKFGTKAHEKAEDPIYVLDHDIPIDTNYYLMNQLQKPLLRLFEPIIGEAKAMSLFSKRNGEQKEKEQQNSMKQNEH